MLSSRRVRLLVIEPDDIWRIQLRNAAPSAVTVDTCANYQSARCRIGQPYTFIVTNIRLAEYNGLQLVYLIRDAHPDCQAIAYTNAHDVWLAREAQRAGAFYELRDRLPVTLPALLAAQLPRRDRRDPGHLDRRTEHCAGERRARDRHLAEKC
jgi:DNA-binding NtrC family response regulator